ncbi:MAG TPA: ABC-type transport auxiliary lipoprotein family protein [Steroidobacteraceae bacterium]|nr:ABC-type transport auxiliary lipoprotein family protein [Steroidobacteraceae bacterium]
MKCAAFMGLALVLAGCGGLRSKGEAEQLYVLHAAAGTPGVTAVPGVLRVARPDVQPGLDTNRIALMRAGNELDYFADSSWGAALPRVLSALATESLARSGMFGSVVAAAPAPVQGDYELLLTVRHFEAQYTGDSSAPQARVTFDCVLTTGAPRRVLGHCNAEAVQNAADNRMTQIVAALERAAQQALAGVANNAAALARADVRK